MGPFLAILLVAVLFAVFAVLTRRDPKACDVHGCKPGDESPDCASCHLAHPTPESNDEHS